MAPATYRTGFGRGALLPAVSCRPACAVTSAPHGEFGASTPNVALPMLDRRRYQRRSPIKKFYGAQPQFTTSLLPNLCPANAAHVSR